MRIYSQDIEKFEVAFRVDGGFSLGMGHVMRCCSIADALSEWGIRSLFICSNSNLQSFLESFGFGFFCTNVDYKEPDKDLKTVKEIICQTGCKIFVSDTYYVSNSYLKSLQSYCQVWCISPDPDRVAACNTILNYSGYVGWEAYSDVPLLDTQMLVGTEYAPLARQYWDKKKIQLKEKVSDILIVSGGSDVFGACPKILNLLDALEETEGIAKNIIVAKLAKYPNGLLSEWRKRPDVRIHFAPSCLADIIERCDLAISAAGTTIYELLGLGVPTICFAVVDNQLQAEGLDGCVKWCGDLRVGESSLKINELTIDRIKDAVIDLLQKDSRDKLINQSFHHFDTLGSLRIAKEIVKAIEYRNGI